MQPPHQAATLKFLCVEILEPPPKSPSLTYVYYHWMLESRTYYTCAHCYLSECEFPWYAYTSVFLKNYLVQLCIPNK